MVWFIVISILLFIIVKYLIDEKKQTLKLRDEGGIEKKYADLISYIKKISADFTEEERDKESIEVKKINDSTVEILINFTWANSFNFIYDSFTLIEAFGPLKVEWKCLEKPKTSMFGGENKEYKLQWTFDTISNSQKVIFKKIITDINSFLSSKKQERSYYKKALIFDSQNTEIATPILQDTKVEVETLKPLPPKSIPISSSQLNESIKYTMELQLDELFEKRDLKKLNELSLKCIEMFPDWYYGYFNQGLINSYSNRLPEAFQDYNNTIRLNSKFSEAYIERAYIKRLMKDYIGAIDDYLMSAKINPQTAAGNYYSIGGLKSEMKDYSGCIEYCNKAIQINPNLPGAYSNRGAAHMQLKDFEAAIVDFNKSILLEPRNENAYYNKALAETQMEKLDDAINSYSQVIKLNPHNLDAYNQRGVLKSKLKTYEAALLDFNKTIELSKNHASAYVNRGYAKVALGDIEGACSDWTNAGDLGYENAYKLIEQHKK